MISLDEYMGTPAEGRHRDVALKATEVELIVVDHYNKIHYYRVLFPNRSDWTYKFTYARLKCGNLCAHDGKGRIDPKKSSVFWLCDEEAAKC